MLKPRLANLDAWIRDNTPVDHSIELERARTRLSDFAEHAKPGRLTRARRQDRGVIEQLTARVGDYDAHEQQREQWHRDHADTFAYRHELAERVRQRMLELGKHAASNHPKYIDAILGPCPDRHPARDRWIVAASRVEAYREEFNIDPDNVSRPPTDGVQRRAWTAAVDTPRRARQAAIAAIREPRDHAPSSGSRPPRIWAVGATRATGMGRRPQRVHGAGRCRSVPRRCRPSRWATPTAR